MSREIEYEIDSGNIKPNSEVTSTVASISYEIEKAKSKRLEYKAIDGQIIKLQERGNLPTNLKYIDSYTDKWTGISTSAFFNKDTGKAIIGVAGTNIDFKSIKEDYNSIKLMSRMSLAQPMIQMGLMSIESPSTREAIKDIVADAAIYTTNVTADDWYASGTQNFIKTVESQYDIEVITGHSKGGRDALLLGIDNNIPNIVTYNTAALQLQSDKSNLFFWDVIDGRRNIINASRYRGRILNFYTNDDFLNGDRSLVHGFVPGEKIEIRNGKGHSMEGFLSEKEQKIIVKEYSRSKPKNIKDENEMLFLKVIKNTKNNLKEVETMRATMLRQNGGALSSSQLKYLESMFALTLAKGFQSLLEQETEHMTKNYNMAKQGFQTLWEDARIDANEFGKRLTDSEQLDALHQGGVYAYKIVDEPREEIEGKIAKLHKIKAYYDVYIKKIEQSINEIVALDQTIASQIGVQ